MKPTLASLFPNASQSCQKANPQIGFSPQQALGGMKPKSKLQGNVERKRGIPNKTEAEFALKLRSQFEKGEIWRYDFEGITLRWRSGDDLIRYTPDFVVIEPASPIRLKLIEVKGGFIKGKFERAIERFKHARTYWPEFSFELHQKTKQGWKRLH